LIFNLLSPRQEFAGAKIELPGADFEPKGLTVKTRNFPFPGSVDFYLACFISLSGCGYAQAGLWIFSE